MIGPIVQLSKDYLSFSGHFWQCEPSRMFVVTGFNNHQISIPCLAAAQQQQRCLPPRDTKLRVLCHKTTNAYFFSRRRVSDKDKKCTKNGPKNKTTVKGFKNANKNANQDLGLGQLKLSKVGQYRSLKRRLLSLGGWCDIIQHRDYIGNVANLECVVQSFVDRCAITALT